MLSCSFLGGHEDDYTPGIVFEQLWNNYNKTYALFEEKQVDWDAVHAKYAPMISSGMSSQELFDVCEDMLCELQDSHVYLQAPFDFCNAGGRYTSADPFSLSLIESRYLQNVHTAGNGMFTYGLLRTDASTGYLYIAGFSYGKTTLEQQQDWAADIDTVVSALSGTSRLIIDIRGNRGGLEGNVSYIAGRFTGNETVYAVTRTKNGPSPHDFSGPVALTILPQGPLQYCKPAALITNKQTISGGEYFALALRSQPNVIHTGSGTAGAFSLSLERVLPNGWRYAVSVQYVTDAAGTCFEGTGIVPVDSRICENTSDGIAAGTDAQLEKAVSLLDQAE
jgi:Periplasmic protease